MAIQEIIALLSGVALFLFGMTLMGDGLKAVAGNKMELILYRLSGTPLRGLLLGTVVTAAIQSSCATSVMAVGFVNAGMMPRRRSVSVIIGAILGTSVTGWVICLGYLEGAGTLKSLLSTATLTGAVAVAGIILRMFTKSRPKRRVGDILLGFAVLMTGMAAMSGAVSSLGESPAFSSIMSSLSNPLLGILVGLVFTALLQSASAAVGIVQALSFTGVMAAGQALPLLLGVAVGAAAPVLLSAIGAGTEGKRAALVYPITAALGTVTVGGVFYAINAFVGFSFLDKTVNPFTVAALNSFLRLAMVILLMPLSGVIDRLTVLLVREKRAAASEPELRLEERFLAYPALALEQCRMAIDAMAKLSRKSVNRALKLLRGYSEEGFSEIKEMEETVDTYEDRLGSYLMRLTGKELTRRQNEDAAKYLCALTDLERISDHALNLAESAKEIDEKRVRFSDAADKELTVLFSAVTEIIHLASGAFEDDDAELAKRVEPLEERIDELCDTMKRRHVERLQAGECTISQGFVFNDILTDLERVADHCSNIALEVLEVRSDTMAAHDYLHDLKEQQADAMREAYDEYAARYAI
ncbi:MAG: Na/Pi cotransporter family protein [Clostridia bacterium]|nr:Na/Pi cotransporter family protein [Clostridia bacterium]